MAQPSDTFWTDLKVNMTPDTVQVRTSSTVNNYGERTFTGGTVTYDAYIRQVTEADRGVIGDDAIVDWVVYIPDSSLALNVDDELTLPAPISGTRPIVLVNTRKSPDGQVGVTAFVGQKRKQGT